MMSKVASSTMAMMRSRTLLHLHRSRTTITAANRFFHPLLLTTDEQQSSTRTSKASSVVNHRPYGTLTTTVSRCFDYSYYNTNHQHHYNTSLDMNIANRSHRNQTTTAITLATTSTLQQKQQQPEPIVLYQRDPNRTFYPRTIIATTTAHTLYWTWYLYDFTVALNIDPTIGYAGLTLAIVMSFGATLYPPSLIHSIRLLQSTNDDNNMTSTKIGIRTYALPFVTPAKKERLYKLGDTHFATTTDVTDILTNHGGDVSQFEGHIPLTAKDRRIHLLLHVDKEKDDIVTSLEQTSTTKGETAKGQQQYGSLWFQYLAPSKAVVGSGGGTAGVGAGFAAKKMKRRGNIDTTSNSTTNGNEGSSNTGTRRSSRNVQRQRRMERRIRSGR